MAHLFSVCTKLPLLKGLQLFHQEKGIAIIITITSEGSIIIIRIITGPSHEPLKNGLTFGLQKKE